MHPVYNVNFQKTNNYIITAYVILHTLFYFFTLYNSDIQN